MPLPCVISFRVDETLHGNLLQRASERGLDIGSFVRAVLHRELSNPDDAVSISRKQLLFVTTALDEILQIHPDTALRERVYTTWKTRVEEERSRA